MHFIQLQNLQFIIINNNNNSIVNLSSMIIKHHHYFITLMTKLCTLDLLDQICNWLVIAFGINDLQRSWRERFLRWP